MYVGRSIRLTVPILKFNNKAYWRITTPWTLYLNLVRICKNIPETSKLTRFVLPVLAYATGCFGDIAAHLHNSKWRLLKCPRRSDNSKATT